MKTINDPKPVTVLTNKEICPIIKRSIEGIIWRTPTSTRWSKPEHHIKKNKKMVVVF